MLSSGECGIIETVRSIHYDEAQTTYNFEVEDFHTYYVGTNMVLCHNACTPSNSKVHSPDEIANKYGITKKQFHEQVKPEILRRVKPNYRVGSNPNIALNKFGDIAYQGVRGSRFANGFQDTGSNIWDIIIKLGLKG